MATYLYAKFLKACGIKVKVVVRGYRSSMLWKDIEIYNIRAIGYGKYFVLDPHSKNLVEKLIEWSDITYFAVLFNLILLAKSFDKPVVVHIHSYFPLCPIGHLCNFYSDDVCVRGTCAKCTFIYERL